MSTLGSGTISFWHSRNDYAIGHFSRQKICLVKRKVLSDEEIMHGCPLSKILLISRLVLLLIKFKVPALPYVSPRSASSSSTSASASFKHSSGSNRLAFQIKASSSEESSGSAEVGEGFSDLKEKWDALEDKYMLILYGGGAIVALWLSSIVADAINSVPLSRTVLKYFLSTVTYNQLPRITELVGLGYTGWFVYRYLLFKSSRKELAAEIEAWKKKIAGS
ncbi:hypothetical protein RHSIM_Rhsim03G0197000 [Rhododendron simsii]|uniref:Cyanobacterial aminoacyl-tRNA synthetase CAAD domain-containing protein n=1 Tax=Rhododendron simsii TaxID=118357 RepID=A0A834H551_RHOSS|nr:hypothetical protein RHSIM_Rhsim03G0197000 [Rhododendron simsii]